MEDGTSFCLIEALILLPISRSAGFDQKMGACRLRHRALRAIAHRTRGLTTRAWRLPPWAPCFNASHPDRRGYSTPCVPPRGGTTFHGYLWRYPPSAHQRPRLAQRYGWIRIEATTVD